MSLSILMNLMATKHQLSEAEGHRPEATQDCGLICKSDIIFLITLLCIQFVLIFFCVCDLKSQIF